MKTSDPQFRSVLIEVFRRGIALVLFITGATAGLGYGRADLAFLGVLVGILFYIALPRPYLPEGAIHHQRVPSVHMPDLLGFMLATTFFALPLIVSAQAPWQNGPWGLYLMTGLPGLISLLILYIALRHQCLWLRPTGHDLTIADLGGIETLSYAEIERVHTETKPPPRWLKPLLVLVGGWRGLGIAIVSDRATHNLIVERKGGSKRRIPADALADTKLLAAALHRGGVTLDAPLEALAGKSGHHRVHRNARHAAAESHHAKRA